MSESPHFEMEEQVSRRDYLRASSAIGISGLLFPRQARRETTTIVTDRARDEPIRVKEVPTKWIEGERKASNVRDRLVENHVHQNLSGDNQCECQDTPEIISIGLVNSDERVGDRFKSKIRVRINVDGPDLALPDSVDGVPIKIEQAKPTASSDACPDDTPYSPVPGGVPIDNPRPDGGTSTATAKAWDTNGNAGLLVCAHAFNQDTSQCDGDITGLDLVHDGNKLGEVPSQDHFNHIEDWAFLNKDGNETDGYGDWIAGAAQDVVGYKTQDGLYEMKSNAATIYQQGWKTCETSGEVTAVDIFHYGGTDDCFSSNHAVETNVHTEGGDSGGPFFDRWYDPADYRDEASLICPLWGSNSERSFGTGAYHIYNQHGIAFTP